MLEGGHHLILDLQGCPRDLLDSPRAMARLCRGLGRVMRARVLETRGLRFHPQGVTAFSVLAESHVSIHTWPQTGTAFLDVFSCQSRFRVGAVIDRALRLLRAKSAEMTLLRREPRRTRVQDRGRIETDGADFDYGPTVFSHRSRYQLIELTRGPLGVSMFLDGHWQFVERYERAYHESLVHPAAVCAPGLRKVGIAGGGDGLALREVLRYPDLGRVLMYELDPAVLGLADGHPDLLRLNRRALRHPKAKVVAADARKMLRPGAGFDLLILDFPSMSESHDFAELYSTPFYRHVRRALAPRGVVVVQVSDYPDAIARVVNHLGELFPQVIPLGVGDGSQVSVYSFVLAGPVPLRPLRPLPSGLSFITPRGLGRLLGDGPEGAAPNRRPTATPAATSADGRRPRPPQTGDPTCT